MQVDRITPDVSRGKGWARLTFKDCEDARSIVSMAIVRPRHAESFLGRMGWQISESRLPVNTEVLSESEMALVLPPAVVQYMEVASNYEFHFFDKEVHRANTVIVRWSGISYRAAKGEVSPIEVVQEAEIPSNESIFGEPVPTPGVHKARVEAPQPPPQSNAEFNNSWLVTSEKSLEPSFEQIDTRERFPSPESSASSPPVLPLRSTIVGSYERQVVRRIKCLNPDCGAEILDSMRKCPFCGSAGNPSQHPL